jgi:hypothetical protein
MGASALGDVEDNIYFAAPDIIDKFKATSKFNNGVPFSFQC